MPTLQHIVQGLTVVALVGLSLYGFLGLYTLFLYYKTGDELATEPAAPPAHLPSVTVQLPVFNEYFVVERLISAAAALVYPRQKLQIQVLDDSEDRTTTRVGQLVRHYQAQGINIEVIHRRQREGYKAGALNEGLQRATGEFIAIFDADFQPEPDFLLRTVPHFSAEPRLGLIQTRWGHLNDSDSLLTAAQALALDKHFVIEQTVRFRARLYPKFNGTAGIWRRTCLEDAGGWESDTVCEDLCLSTRAVLRGWQFHYLPGIVAPAELPATFAAYKNQQARWAKGSTQCLIKFGSEIWGDRQQRFAARFYALLTMAAYSTSVLLILLLLAQVPLLVLDIELPPLLALLGVAGVGQPLLFVLSQRVLYPDWKRRVWRLPGLLLIAIGLSATIARAVLEAVVGRGHEFIRTPKLGDKVITEEVAYRLPFDAIVFVELLLALYALAAMTLALWQGAFSALPFLGSCALGFGLVAGTSLVEGQPNTR